MLLLPLLSCSLSLLLAFGCSSCTARELAALLPHPQQIKKACTAQRTVTNRFAVHRRGAHDFVAPLAAAHATAPTARSAPLENFECLQKSENVHFLAQFVAEVVSTPEQKEAQSRDQASPPSESGVSAFQCHAIPNALF